MAAAREQRGEGRDRGAVLEHGREQVPFEMVHADHGHAERRGERLREAHAHQQRPDESRPVRHADGVHLVERAARVAERAPHDGCDRREMRARRDLGHHATEDRVHVLREDHERVEGGVVTSRRDHGSRSLVARALDAEDAH